MSDQKAAQPRELTCEECRDLLSEHADKELDAESQASVEKHLSSCEKCGTESTRLHGIKRIVQHWDGVKGSGEWRKAVMEEFVRESRMMPSAPFTEAADSVREDGQATRKGLSAKWVIGIAVALGIAAFILVRILRG